MSSIRYLHFTDLHFGMSPQKWLWPTIQDQLYDDLRRMFNRCGPWDLVLFSGDLVQSGQAEEFALLNTELEHLWSFFGSLGCQPVMACVPGNHDIQRPVPVPATVRLMRNWFDEPDLRQMFWTDPTSEYRQAVAKAFANYESWVHSAPVPILQAEHPGFLPGDGAAILEKGGVKLGVVGLNSTFLQLTGDNYEGKLELDSRQFAKVTGGHPRNWCRQADLCILMTHHNTAWLHQNARRAFRSEIYTSDRFFAHFCGHLHTPETQDIREAGANVRRVRQGNSLFGLERWGTNQEERRHGYSAGCIELGNGKGTEYFWPRDALINRAGDWQIGADRFYTLDDNQAVVTEFLLKDRPLSPKVETPLVISVSAGARPSVAAENNQNIDAVLPAGTLAPTEARTSSHPEPHLAQENREISEHKLPSSWEEKSVTKWIGIILGALLLPAMIWGGSLAYMHNHAQGSSDTVVEPTDDSTPPPLASTVPDFPTATPTPSAAVAATSSTPAPTPAPTPSAAVAATSSTPAPTPSPPSEAEIAKRKLDTTLVQARKYMAATDWLKGAQSYSEVLKLKDDSLEALSEQASAYDYMGDDNNAKIGYMKAIKISPKGTADYYYRGDAFYSLQKYDDAEADFKSACRLQPTDSRGYWLRGRANQRLARYDLAKSDLEKATEQNPKNGRAFKDLGGVYTNLKDYRSAVDAYSKAIKLNPNNTNAVICRAAVYYGMKEYDLAIEDCTSVLKVKPRSYMTLNNRADSYRSLGNNDSAIRDLKEAIKIFPNHGSYMRLGIIYYETHNHQLAIENLTKAIDGQEDADLHIWRGHSYYEQHNYVRAIADYNKALEIDPNNRVASLSRASARKMLSDSE